MFMALLVLSRYLHFILFLVVVSFDRTINTHIISVSIFPPAKAELVKNVTLVFKNLKVSVIT